MILIRNMNARRIAAFGIAAMLTVAGSIATAQEIALLGGQRVISVTAEAQVAARPDIAWIGVGVIARAEIASDALEMMGTSVDGVLAALAEFGIADQDVQTDQLSLEQLFNYGSDDQSVPQGFMAVSNLSVTVRDIDSVGDVLDRVVDGGANRLNGISFTVEDGQDVLDDARRAAVTEATRRAQVFATAAGVTLGDLIALSDVQSYGASAFAVEAADRSVPVATGSVTLSAAVRLTFEIAE